MGEARDNLQDAMISGRDSPDNAMRVAAERSVGSVGSVGIRKLQAWDAKRGVSRKRASERGRS